MKADINAFTCICNNCGKQVSGGVYILNVFYCPMCASIINKNNGLEYNNFNNLNSFENDACKNCPNNPKNGGNGICHCILGLPQITC